MSEFLSLHQTISFGIVLLVIDVFAITVWRRYWPELDSYILKTFSMTRIPEKWKIWIMVVLLVASVYLYTYCAMCRVLELAPDDDDRMFFDWIFYDLLGIVPWFVWGCTFAGFILKYLRQGKLRLPRSMIGAGAFASILPICSCAAVPLAHGMMLGKQMRVRAIIAFLIVVPVLSPVWFFIAFGKGIGLEFIVAVIISVFTLAFASGIFIEKYAGEKEEGDDRPGAYTCAGCSGSCHVGTVNSGLAAGLDQVVYLLKYILLGIVIGAIIASQVEAEIIQTWFGTNEHFFRSIFGLFLIVLLAIPIFICNGEDIIILTPMLVLGLPLGHAVTFSIAGNAICITAVPVLMATFGKKVTILIFIAFFVGSMIMGLVINSLWYLFA